MKKFLKLLALGLVTMTSSLLLVACGGISQQTKDSTGGQEVQRPIEKTSCLVTFDSCGGSVVSDQEITRGGKVKKTIPVYSGYDFFGWYTDAQYTKKFDFDSTINQDITLYAKWSNDASELYNFELTNDYSFYGITGYNGESEEITLPRLYNGLRVISVNSNAFKNNTVIKKVTLPNTIQNIYTSAFEGCTNLSSVEIPNSVHSIGENSFSGCISLDNLIIPGSVEIIDTNAFQNCSGLINITLQNGIKTISPMAFDYCISLRNVVLPNSVTSVGGMAFRHCDSLTAVTISTGMSEIANAMFQYCGSLESLILPKNIIKIGNSAFSYCYSLEDLQILGNISLFGNSAFYDCQNLKSIYWAASITGNYQSGGDNYIFYNAGKSNNGITLTMAPDAGLPVGVFMPYQNSNIPNITKVVFEDGTTTIDSTEYNRMPYLTSITAPDSVRDITAGIFDNTPWYQAQPNGVVCINNIVYGYKGNYTSNIVVSDNVVAFGNNVFAGATGITSLTLPFVGRSQDATESNRLFGALFSNETYNGSIKIEQRYADNKTVDYYMPQSLKKVIIKNETVIPYGAFSGCTNLNTIDLSHCVNLSEVESCAFGGFDNLDNVVFPEQEITLASNAYENMPSSLISIENLNSENGTVSDIQTTTINKIITLTAVPNTSRFYAVWYDENANILAVSSNYTFKTGCTKSSIKVEFKKASYFIYFDDNGKTSELAINYSEQYTLPIPSERSGYDFGGWYLDGDKFENGLYPFHNDITLVAQWNLIYDLVSNTDDTYAINGLTNYGKQNCADIIIPNKIDGHLITSFSFNDCSNITSIIIPNGFTSICENAFSGCAGLISIEIPCSVTSIGNYAFSGCAGLISIEIPYSVTSIGNYTFSDCASLVSIIVASDNTKYTSTDGNGNECNCIIEKSTKELIVGCKTTVISSNIIGIRYGAFEGCTGLKTVTIPTSVTSVKAGSFKKCYNLTSIIVASDNTKYTSTDGNGNECNCIIEKSSKKLIVGCKTTVIPSSVTQIGSSAFYGCVNLTSITLPSSITTIDSNAFEGCTDLTRISFPSNVTSIGGGAFRGCSSLTSMGYSGAGLPHITHIGNYAFEGCTNLGNALLGYAEYVGDYAFRGCVGLKTLNLRGGPTIHTGAFAGCTNVTSAILGEGTCLCTNIFDGWTSSQTINFIDSADASERWYDDWKKGCSANIVWGYTE